MYENILVIFNENDPNLDFFEEVFKGLKTNFTWLDVENKTPKSLKKMLLDIEEIDAIFVLASETFNSNNFQCRFNFVLGGAASHRSPPIFPFYRKEGVDTYLFKPKEPEIKINILYATHYMVYNPLKNIEKQKEVIHQSIKKHPGTSIGNRIKCSNKECESEFILLSNDTKITCPICGEEFKV